ncbi:MAG: cyclic nucleotide-binding domain-containing protein [Acetobacteraceae bacterium]
MAIEGLARIVREQKMFAGLNEGFIELAAGCAKNVRFDADGYLFRTGEAADWLYLVRGGRVALEVVTPGRGAVQFLSLGAGEVVGISWLLPPFRWGYDARAVEPVRAVAMDARCLRDKCEADHDLGYAVLKRFLPVLVERLQATRLQMLDVYGAPR